jgi:hypothetical protein
VNTAPSPTVAAGWRNAALFGGATAIFLWQLRHPFLRFDSSIANDILGFALGLCLPWLTMIAIFRSWGRWGKGIALVAIVPLVLYSAAWLLGGAWFGLAYRGGRNLSFDRFAAHAWRGSEIRLYRTDGGATTDYGVVLRQERTVLPGLRLVRRIDDFYPCYSLGVASTEDGIAVAGGAPECEGLAGLRREYRLKSFVYF